MTPKINLHLFRLGLLLPFLSLSGFSQTKVELGLLAKNNNAIKYIAIGSSLSSGVRDGGINSVTQQTSFPALLAQQMQVNNFKQPLFEREGTPTKKLIVAKNGTISFQEIKGVSDSQDFSALPKINYEVDNLAIPYLKAMNIEIRENEKGAFLPSFDKRQYKHLNRFLNTDEEKNISYKNLLEKNVKEVNFFTLEVGFHDFVSYYINGGYGQDISFVTHHREGNLPELEIISLLKSKGANGVIANVPNVIKFPFFKYYTYNYLTSKVGKGIFVQRYGKNDIRLINDHDIFIPSEGISALLNGSEHGLKAEDPLLDEEVLGSEETIDVIYYNNLLSDFARQSNIPIVDLNGLYEKILKGTFITDDGVKIDPSYPKGNFFSEDGIHPTAIGQGVITNEFIKTINSFYKSNIPLIKISDLK